MEDSVAEAKDAPVGRYEPVSLPVVGGCHADDRLVQVDAAGRAIEVGVTEAEDAPVLRDEPVAPPSGVAAMPTTGWFSRIDPVEPKNRASPKLKMPPSPATIQ